MKKTILVCGHGPGISDAVARRFGAEGFVVGLVARHADRVQAAAARLKEAGIVAEGFTCDLGDPVATGRVVATAREKLGPLHVVHWNAYGGGAGDLLTATPAEIAGVYNVSVVGLVAAVQAALPEWETLSSSALLITGGGLNAYHENVDKMAVDWNAMGLALGKSAQHKLAGLLHQKLKSHGVYVGEVIVMGAVKGTSFDRGSATIEASQVAQKFWDLFVARSDASASVS